MVLTSDEGFFPISSKTVRQRSYLSCPIQTLLGRHHDALASLGYRGEVAPTPEGRVEATHHYYAVREIRLLFLWTGVIMGAVVLLVLSTLIYGVKNGEL
jgi:hypothetical protein